MGFAGEGECGAVRAGEQILGEILGDPDPTGAVTPSLRAAVGVYRDRIRAELPRGGSADLVCNHLTAPFPDFASPERAAFCAGLAERVALLVADTLEGAGHPVALPPPPTR